MLFERLGKSRRRLIANAGRNPGDGVVARFEHQCGLVHPSRDEVTIHRLADEPSKTSREGRAAEPHLASQRAKRPMVLGVFVDQLKRLADVPVRNCTEPPTFAVAYLTAQITLTLAGFKPGMMVLAPGIGGSVGNATYQLARAQGAGKVTSTAGSATKTARARELGFEDVIDLTGEGLTDGIRRITAGSGVDIVIESIGGAVTSEALSSLGLGGVLITLGYSAGRKTTIDVTDLIWKRARMEGFSLFAQSPTAIATAWRDIIPLIVSGSVRPPC